MATRLESLTERLVTRIEGFLPIEAVGNPRRETQDRLERMSIGQMLQASVVAKLEDGSFIVDLGSAAAHLRTRMTLPADTRIGQRLNLSLLGKSPQPTFQVEPDTGTTVTSLSSGARLLENILVDRKESTAILTGKTPVLTTAQLPSAQIEQALRQVIETSGLSYEAHVMQWLNGTRPLALLQQEPQQRLYQKNMQVQQSGIKPVADSASNPGAAAATTENPTTGMATADQTTSAELAQLVSAQIDTLEHKRFQWQGEIWPNQLMLWTASEEADHTAGHETPKHSSIDAETDQKAWVTILSLNLPGLGPVQARIRLQDERVQIEMRGQDAATVQRLRRQGLHLSERMSSAGIGLTALTIREGVVESVPAQASGEPA